MALLDIFRKSRKGYIADPVNARLAWVEEALKDVPRAKRAAIAEVVGPIITEHVRETGETLNREQVSNIVKDIGRRYTPDQIKNFTPATVRRAFDATYRTPMESALEKLPDTHRDIFKQKIEPALKGHERRTGNELSREEMDKVATALAGKSVDEIEAFSHKDMSDLVAAHAKPKVSDPSFASPKDRLKAKFKDNPVASHTGTLRQIAKDEKGAVPSELLVRAGKRAKKLNPKALKELHALEAQVVPRMHEHFGALSEADQLAQVKYLMHPHALPEVKQSIRMVPSGPYAHREFEIKGVNGKFVQHPDGSIINHVEGRRVAVVHGSEIATHMKPPVIKPPVAAAAAEKAAEKEIGALKSMRNAVFKNKAMRGVGKYVVLPAAIAGGLFWLTTKGKTEYNARDHMHDPLPDMVLPPVVTPDMLSGPAEGRGNAEWQTRVAAMRGGQQINGPINPAQNVAEAADMGAALQTR